MSEEDNQVVDSTSSTVAEDVTSDDSEDIEVLKAELEKAREIKRIAEIRTKKAEAELKSYKDKPAEAVTSTLSEEDIEVKILKAKGIDAELLDEMKILAKVRGKSILEIENDPILIAMKNEKEAKHKAEKAKLGASKGSGQVKQAKTVNSPGLSQEEHKALWKESMGL